MCNKTNVPYFGSHALRYAGASLLDSSNEVSIGSIQRLLGHENRTTTEIYLHSLGDSEVEAIMVLDRAREKSHTESYMKQKSTYRRVK